MQARYSFKGGQRGRYAHLFPQVPHIVILSPDVAAAFPDSDAVNEALRKLLASGGTSWRLRPIAVPFMAWFQDDLRLETQAFCLPSLPIFS